MNWDEKRPAYTVAADWTYAMSASTLLNVTVDTNGFLQQTSVSARGGTRRPMSAFRLSRREMRRSCVLPRSSGPA